MSPAFRPGSLLARVRQAFSGETRALPQVNAPFYSTYGATPLFKPSESLDAYGDNVWLYRSVLTLSMELARIPLRLQKKTAEGEIKYIESHQAIDLMNRPQPTKTGKCQLSGMMLRVITGMHMMLNGEAFWVLQRRLRPTLGGAPQFIDLAMPQYMRPVLDKDNEIQKYVYSVPGSGKDEELDPPDVVHFRLPDPKSWIRGHSPVQSIKYSVDTQRQADILNTKRLSNNGVPPGVLESEQSLTPEQREALRLQWQGGFAGVVNSGKVPVMPHGLKFNKINETNQEMQFLEGKNVTRDEILANYGMGLEILGKTESQTRANAEAAIFVFQRFGVLPFIELKVDCLNNDYLPAFPATDGLFYGFPDPVPENLEEKRANADSLALGGALTPNERRKMFGLEPLELPGMDTPYLPINMMPVGEDPITPNAAA